MTTFSDAADLELALRAAREAATAILPFFRRDTPVDYKSPDQPVTEADRLADRILHARLLGERAGDGWLSEETADTPERLERERVWLVDPIDGTNSFIEGRAEYVISIALAVGGEARVGVVFNPSTGEMYHAVRGGGAFLDGARIRIPAGEEAREMLASRSEIGRGEFDPLRGTWRLRPLGSTAYKMVKVADGTGTAYLSRGPKSEWDVAAAALIVAEAGGVVTDLAGATLRLNRPAPFLRGVIAARATVHEEIVRHLTAPPRGVSGGQGEDP
jgi:myo-inositol-1(or 4)-monophosphatase